MKKHLAITTTALLAALALPLTSTAMEAEQNQGAEPDKKNGVVVQKHLVLGPDGVLMDAEGGQGLEALLNSGELPPEIKKMLEQFGNTERLGGFGQLGTPAPEIQATYLGVNCEPLGLEAGQVLGLPASIGLRVGFVAEGSPAESSGLVQGDVITRLNDQLLVNPEQFAVLVRTFAADDTVSLDVIREGKKLKLQAKLASKMVPALGPGGADLSREWRLDLSNPAIKPAPQNGEVPKQIEQLLQQAQAAGGTVLQLDGDADAEAIKDLITDMLMQQNLQGDQIDRIREALDLNLSDMLDQAKLNPMGGAVGTSQIMWGSQNQRIKVTLKDNGTHLVAENKEGEILFDGPVPADGDFGDLPKELQDMLNNARVDGQIDLMRVLPIRGQ